MKDLPPSEPSNGLPLADLGSSNVRPSLRYARVMYSAGHGLAPWSPMPERSMDSWERNGVTIGDVGYIDIDNGSFQHLFNIFFDKKTPGDSVVTIPDNFAPINPPFSEWEVRVTSDFFGEGAVVTSEGVTATRVSEDKLYVPSDYAFSPCSSRRKGIHFFIHGKRRRDPSPAERWISSRPCGQGQALRLHLEPGA